MSDMTSDVTGDILTEIDSRGVARVTLNRADKHNALSSELILGLTDLAGELAANDAVRVVVLTGAGKSFCAGGDLKWMKAQIEGDADSRAREARKLARMLAVWNALPKPVIARIQGPAYGGGVGMACIADISIAVDSALFGLTETRLGLIPATIGPHVMARLGPVGRQVFMSSKRFGVDDALRLGLIARAVPEAELDAAVEAELAPYLKVAPSAVARAKAIALRSVGEVTEEAIEASIADLVAQWESPDAAEGIAAFFEKRNPSWDQS